MNTMLHEDKERPKECNVGREGGREGAKWKITRKEDSWEEGRQGRGRIGSFYVFIIIISNLHVPISVCDYLEFTQCYNYLMKCNILSSKVINVLWCLNNVLVNFC